MNRAQLETYVTRINVKSPWRVAVAFRRSDLLTSDDYKIDTAIVAINNYPHAEIGIDRNTQDLTPVAEYIGKITGVVSELLQNTETVFMPLPPGNTVYEHREIDVYTFEYGGQLNYVIEGVSMKELERNPATANAVANLLRRLFDRYQDMKGNKASMPQQIQFIGLEVHTSEKDTEPMIFSVSGIAYIKPSAVDGNKASIFLIDDSMFITKVSFMQIAAQLRVAGVMVDIRELPTFNNPTPPTNG